MQYNYDPVTKLQLNDEDMLKIKCIAAKDIANQKMKREMATYTVELDKNALDKYLNGAYTK